MNDYDYDNDNQDFGDSDEDTEDASETESMKYQNDEYGNYSSRNYENNIGSNATINTIQDDHHFDHSTYEIKEQIYQDKLAQLKDQLAQLERGTHPEFLQRLESIREDYQNRLFGIESNFALEKHLIDNWFQLEEKLTIKEFEERKYELIESLITDLEEKRKITETDSNFELINDASEPKALITRKLRRRPNDPTPLPDRRRRASPAHISYLLEDCEINEDLKCINKYLYQSTKSSMGGHRNSSSNKNSSSSSTVNTGGGGGDHHHHSGDGTEARIDSGKLFYEKKWFHRGQAINLESSDGNSISGSIMLIGINEIFVRRSNDNGKTKVTLNDLHSKKYVIQRR